MAENPGVINALKESQKEGARVIKDELKDQFKPFTDQLLAPLNNIKAGIEFDWEDGATLWVAQ